MIQEQRKMLFSIMAEVPINVSPLAKEIGISPVTLRKLLYDDSAKISCKTLRKIKAYLLYRTKEESGRDIFITPRPDA